MEKMATKNYLKLSANYLHAATQVTTGVDVFDYNNAIGLHLLYLTYLHLLHHILIKNDMYFETDADVELLVERLDNSLDPALDVVTNVKPILNKLSLYEQAPSIHDASVKTEDVIEISTIISELVLKYVAEDLL